MLRLLTGLAAIWNLPAIFVVANNGYAESTSVDYAVASDSYVDRATGFGMPGITAPHTPVPFSPALEDLYIPSAERLPPARARSSSDPPRMSAVSAYYRSSYVKIFSI